MSEIEKKKAKRSKKRVLVYRVFKETGEKHGRGTLNFCRH